MADREILGKESSRQGNSECRSPEVGTRSAHRKASVVASVAEQQAE